MTVVFRYEAVCLSREEPKYWGSVKGEILEAMTAFSWEAYSFGSTEYIDWYGLTQFVPLPEDELLVYVNELVRDGDFIRENDSYHVRPELLKEYIEYIDYEIERAIEEDRLGVIQVRPMEKRDVTVWTDGWVKIHKPEISMAKEHFYLEGWLLDAFVKFLISKANETIIVVTPYLDMITPTKLLIDATQRSKRVVLVTRSPEKTSTRNYLKELSNSGITVLYNNKIHAKILLCDDKVAIVSSMNFLVGATAGWSWEAGIITLDKQTVDMIKDSLTTLPLDPAKL